MQAADIEMRCSSFTGVGFPDKNVADYVTTDVDSSDGHQTFILTGDKGYKTALTGYGVKHGDYYFEVEVLSAKTPLPFVGVKSALRVGLTTFKEQDLEMPLGCSTRSYSYGCTGRLITN
jgi:hypothetical protein